MPDNFLILPASDVSGGRLTTLSRATITTDLNLSVTGLTNGTEVVVYQLGPGVSGTPQALPANTETHVFALAGQSNMIGRAAFDGGAKWPAGTMQIGRGTQNGALIPAQNPADGPTTSRPLAHFSPTLGDMGLDLQFAIDYLADKPGVSLMFIPCAQGATGFSDNAWNPGNWLYNDTIARINAAIAAHPGFLFKGFLWHQGETDAGIAGTYAGLLDDMITNMRADVSAADATTPFILGGLASGNVGRDVITDIIAQTPARVSYTGFADAAGLGRNDANHFNAAGLRALGSRYNAAIAQAVANVPVAATAPAAPTGLAAVAGDGEITLTWTAPNEDGGAPITDYQIERDGGSGFALIADGPGTGTTFTDSGLVNGTAYTYRLRAVNSTGPGPASATATTTPIAPIITPPTGPVPETGAVAHWLFGDDNTTNADLISARLASGPAHAQSTGYITSPAGIQQGLDTGIAEADIQTMCFVFQLAGTTNSIIGGTLEAPGGDLSTGVSPFSVVPSKLWVNMRGGWGNTQVSGTTPLANGFAFVAVSKNVSTGAYVLFVGDLAGSHVVAGSASQTTSPRSIGIGSLYFSNANFNGQISTAETIIFDSAKTQTEIEAIYQRSRTRLAARSVTVL
ncbi:hypothetical protein ROLI_045290 (plasmid) [Roseobacter fucihabitans]|uniref:Fibronectin type-III domain-containing protein n=1 Tax=Roseobacter fucihabitans TaxID=1537242 RepID=A0ABZ2BZA7_9RHOB|nr:sialate O-acetylesterase [Roseobacter litoralis]MBC6967244.1 Fibronectin type III domain protein [Roseobacter litoralis]